MGVSGALFGIPGLFADILQFISFASFQLFGAESGVSVTAIHGVAATNDRKGGQQRQVPGRLQHAALGMGRQVVWTAKTVRLPPQADQQPGHQPSGLTTNSGKTR